MGKGNYVEVSDFMTLKDYGDGGIAFSTSSRIADAYQLRAVAEKQALQSIAERDAASKLYREAVASKSGELKDAQIKIDAFDNKITTKAYNTSGREGSFIEASGSFELKDPKGQYIEAVDGKNIKVYKTSGREPSFVEASGSFELKDAKGQFVDVVKDKDVKVYQSSGRLVNPPKPTAIATSTPKPIVDTYEDIYGEAAENVKKSVYKESATTPIKVLDDVAISTSIAEPYVDNKKVTTTAVEDINAKVTAIGKDIDDIKAYVKKLKAPNNLDLYGSTLNTFKNLVNMVDSNFESAKKTIKIYEDKIQDVENTYSRKYDELSIPNIKTSSSIPAISGIDSPEVPGATVAVPPSTGVVPIATPTATSVIVKPTLSPVPTSTVVINPPTTPIPIGTVPLYELPTDDSAYFRPEDVVAEIGRTPAKNSGYSGGYSYSEPEPEPEPEPVVEPETVPPIQEAPAAEITFVPDYSYDEPITEDVVSEPQVSYIQDESSGGDNPAFKIAGGLALAAGATLGTYATAKAVKDKKEDDDEEDEDDDNSYTYGQYSRRYGDK